MELTIRVFEEFIEKLVDTDKEIRTAFIEATSEMRNLEVYEKEQEEKTRTDSLRQIKERVSSIEMTLSSYQKKTGDVLKTHIENSEGLLERLQKCKEMLRLVQNAEKSIVNRSQYISEGTKGQCSIQISLDDILHGKTNAVLNAINVNKVLETNNSKEVSSTCSAFYNLCRESERILGEEIERIRNSLLCNKESMINDIRNIGKNLDEKVAEDWRILHEKREGIKDTFYTQRKTRRFIFENTYNSSQKRMGERLERLTADFCYRFPPGELLEYYKKVYSSEPLYEKYECCKQMPRNIRLGSLEYGLDDLGVSDYTKKFVSRYYPFMFKGNRISIPFCSSFEAEFNSLFKYGEYNRIKVAQDARNMGIRLFMMFPPGKVKFTFIDPVRLGESFAIFNRLVDVDDRTSEVINGKIWSDPIDIETKLRIITDHISNVTQRCLQGKYKNIYEYNSVAEQNAEPYHVLMLMDYPAGLTERSLKLLEQIITSGAKCGVFCIAYQNESQRNKISDYYFPIIENMGTNLRKFDYSDDCTKILLKDRLVKGKSFNLKRIESPSEEQLDSIIAILKKGIKNSEKVVVGIEKVSEVDEVASTKDGIRIPIGLRGANEVQYLTLGVGGSHHALIAGVAGSGKSSLLHTIILQALSQYEPNELRIYLVDFKRGVEFKIYADYKLPSFEVVAIESEREFGYNILKALEREQKIRADRFKRVKDRKIDRIEDYRALPNAAPMPRILVIMDEFHELFSNANDKIGKESAEMMERIVRQGRAFGVHIILASQSYSNVGGLDKSVYDQMAVRIVLKCSKVDASLLLGDGSSDVDQISIDDPGRAIYNSEAGNKEYNSHFRVAFIDPSKHREILEGVSERTCKLSDNKTRILLSNIEDNKYSIFNQFTEYDMEACKVPGRLYLGEPLSVVNNLNMDLVRNEYANMLMIGSDSDKARSMFAFTMLSLAINNWVSHNKKAPDEPFIYFLNYKPLRDDYFIDAPGLLATELLTKYVKNIPISNPGEIKKTIQELYSASLDVENSRANDNKYLMVFGYQRAEDLKSEDKAAEKQDIMSVMSLRNQGPTHSMKEMVEVILTMGAQNGIHSVFWQDDFKALDFADRKLITYFYQKIAFDMPKEDYSQFVGVNDISQFGENTAVYNNRIDDVRSFRPYQSPDKEWLENVCESLNQ